MEVGSAVLSPIEHSVHAPQLSEIGKGELQVFHGFCDKIDVTKHEYHLPADISESIAKKAEFFLMGKPLTQGGLKAAQMIHPNQQPHQLRIHELAAAELFFIASVLKHERNVLEIIHAEKLLAAKADNATSQQHNGFQKIRNGSQEENR